MIMIRNDIKRKRFLHIGIRKALIVKKKNSHKGQKKKTFTTNHMYKAYGPVVTFRRWHGVEQLCTQINKIFKIK